MRTKRTGIEALSGRERQVFDCILAGLPGKEIAFKLGLKRQTVSTYTVSVRDKLGATSMVDLVKAALRHGLISLDD